MNRHQAEWLLRHDFTETPARTCVCVNLIGDKCEILLANGNHDYRIVIPQYAQLESPEAVDKIVADYIHHFENLIQTR